MTESFGARLRRERERQHISLAEIAQRTKIKASLFEGLERDDPSRWPSGIFRRSFMRAYANALGLDADALVREFVERFPDPSAPAAPDGAGANSPPASAPPPADAAAPAPSTSHLRLTLVETGVPFTGGRFLADARRRWSAAAWDLGSLLAIAVSIFMFMDVFWMPFGVTALCYYIGGILLLGNSPGVCLFGPRPTGAADGGPKPSRITRHRPADAPSARPAEAAFRTSRFRAERHRELRG
jgi:transcriptional regulator with XRE-family HTH domain